MSFQNNWMPSLQSRFIDELDQKIIKTINHASDHLNSFQEAHFDEYNQDYGLKPKKISFQDNEVSSYRTVVDMEI